MENLNQYFPGNFSAMSRMPINDSISAEQNKYQRCGYDTTYAAVGFHPLNLTQKDFQPDIRVPSRRRFTIQTANDDRR